MTGLPQPGSRGFASLCLLAYERPGLLKHSIDAIHNTAGAPFELIVHDDGSKDPEVHRVLDMAVAKGQVSTVITNTPGHNQGVGVAINRCFKIAEGDVLVKLDADLTYRQDWLFDTLHMLKLNRYEWATGMEPQIGMLGLVHYQHHPVKDVDCRITGHSLWDEQTHILGSAFAMPRSAWKAFGPFSEYSAAFSEDWERMREITATDGWACGLPHGDILRNEQMGLGRSTVVEPDGSIHQIHMTPLTFGADA
jgi:glycosyltransferase involved in cell wall biosynthesis